MNVCKRLATKALRVLVAFCLVTAFIPLAYDGAYADDAATSPDADSAICAVDASEEGHSYVAGQMLVMFKESTTRSTASRALGTLDVEEPDDEVIADSLADATPVLVELEEGVGVAEAVAQANENPAVAYAQPNYIYTLPANEEVIVETEENATSAEAAGEAATTEASAAGDAAENEEATPTEEATPADAAEDDMTVQYTPNDPAVTTSPASSWKNAWQLSNIGAFEAWDCAKTNGTVTVAILDTGCYVNHEDLKDNIWLDYAYDATSDCTLTTDGNGHGTHVAGCVAATADNGLGTAGASFNAKVLPVGVFDSNGYCYTSTLITAYDYVMKYADTLNIRVINMSLGGYGSKTQEDYAFESKITAAKAQGILTVAAGGNGDDDGNPITEVNFPSDSPNVLAVTALSTDGVSPTTWCDYNEYKDICAPGMYIFSTYASSKRSYARMSGTSMAAPIVSGCAALLWAANPDLTVDEVEEAIKATAKPLTVEGGREGLYGAGRLDIAAAVKYVTGVTITTTTLEADTGAQLQLECHNATKGAVQWSVENGTGSATIDSQTGLLDALMPGTVTVSASVPGVENAIDSVTVTVNALSLASAPGVVATNEGLQVTWEACANAKGYLVERSCFEDSGFEEIASVEDGTVCYLDRSALYDTDYYYRIIPYSSAAKTGTGYATSATKAWRIDPYVALAEHPVGGFAVVGEAMSMSVGVGSEAVVQATAYQWQYSDNGDSWCNVPETFAGCTSDTLTFAMADDCDGRLWRCVVTLDSGQAVASSSATTVLPLRGDVNANTSINIVDAQIALDMANGTYGSAFESLLAQFCEAWGMTCTYAAALSAADANEDSTLNALDARAIQYYAHYGQFGESA